MWTMPFGKWKGKSIDSIPADYLEWVLDNTEIEERNPRLYQAILEELGIESPGGKSTIKPADDVVGKWYKKLATRFHPDKEGGSHEAMVAINEARDLLISMMKPSN